VHYFKLLAFGLSVVGSHDVIVVYLSVLCIKFIGGSMMLRREGVVLSSVNAYP